MRTITILVFGLCFLPHTIAAENQISLIDQQEIMALQAQLIEAKESSSSARKKLGIRRVIRSCEGLLGMHSAAPNRFEVLGILYESQQVQIKLESTDTNRKALLETARSLAEAPDDYAALRFNADLLVTQIDLARQEADSQTRADVLKSLIQRYLGTEVQTRAVRTALHMAIERGDAGLIHYLRKTIAQEFPGDMELINFQRDNLTGQIFGAPFIGTFETTNGEVYRFPMDGMGKTTALYFWSKEGGGVERLKEMAEGWKQVPPETDASGRYQVFSFNLDNLPDAGESILREAGLDWPALHFPQGRDNPVYMTYVRNDPELLTMSPTGYTAIFMSDSIRPGRSTRTWSQKFQSAMSRSWARPQYVSQLQSLLAGEFLVLDPVGDFDPDAPPEWKAVVAGDQLQIQRLTRSPASVPVEALIAIQACFVKPPMRYRMSSEEVRANYQHAVKLCDQAIVEHPEARDLWIVRNRRIVALMGLWKLDGQRSYYEAAMQEAKAALDTDYPSGTDVVARFCLAREDLRNEEADLHSLIRNFVSPGGQDHQAATVYALASLLALEIGDRKLHEQYRRANLDKHTNTSVVWNVTSFLTDRYHRYWLDNPPFISGRPLGRRPAHFISIGTPEDARRTLQLELKTTDGETVRIPEDADGKWSVIEFRQSESTRSYLKQHGAFIKDRPFGDAKLYAVLLDDGVSGTNEASAQQSGQDGFPTLLLPGGLDHPVVQHLGILDEHEQSNVAIIRPDGTIAAFLSGLTLSRHKGNALQNILQWHDEKAVDDALARGDLDEAKRLAFAFAPSSDTPSTDLTEKQLRKISAPYMRARAKVHMAMGDWEAAYADVQIAHTVIKKQIEGLSMMTDEFDRIERLRASIIKRKDELPPK